MVYQQRQDLAKMEVKPETISAQASGSSTSISTSSSSESTVVISVADVTKENRRYDNGRQYDNRHSDYGVGDRDSHSRRMHQHHDRDRGYAKKTYNNYNRKYNQGHGNQNNGYYNGNNGYHGHNNGYGGNSGYGNRGYKRGNYNNDFYPPTHHHANYHHSYNGYGPHYTFPYFNTPSQARGSSSGQIKSISEPEKLTADVITPVESASLELKIEESASSNSIEDSSSNSIEIEKSTPTHNDEDILTSEDPAKSIDTSETAESFEKYDIASPSPLSESDCSTIPPSASPIRSSPEPEEDTKGSSSNLHPTNTKSRRGSGNSRAQVGDSSVTGNGIHTVGWGIDNLEQHMYFNTTKGYYTYPPSCSTSHNFPTDTNRHGYHYSNYHSSGSRSYYPSNRRDANFDMYNSAGGNFYPNYFPHDPHHYNGTVYNPAAIPPAQFMFQPPEIGLNDIIKNANSLSLAASTEKWGYSLDDEKQLNENANYGSRSISPSNSMNNSSSGQTYHSKKRNAGAPVAYSVGQMERQGGYRRGGYRTGPFYEPRWSYYNQFPIEEMIKKYKYVEKEDKPEFFVSSGTSFHNELEMLSYQIWIKFQKNQQTPEMFRKKLELWRELSEDFKQINPMYQLEIVGSTISGFGSNTSDIDICLLLNHRNETDPRSEAIDILENLSPRIELIPNLEKTDLILAKVPILKLKERTREIDIDINVNNSVGLRNTHLMYAYGQADSRVRPLVLVVKLWASFHGINDAKCMTLSSYSLSLMVIHYLQHGVSPPVLPNLQQLFPERFSQFTEISKVRRFMMDPVHGLPAVTNTQCLGELLIGFLEYYAVKFDYKTNAVSVRTGSTLPIKQCAYKQAPKNDSYQWKFVNIEGDKPELTTDHYPFKILEPFEFTNTARSVYDKEVFDRIRGIFITSWQRLKYTHDLESIFTPTSPLEARLIGSRVRTATAEVNGILPAN